MDLSTSPLFERLAHAEHVLIAGAGGGFDIFSGLPLYFRLRELGKKVSLANLSHAALREKLGFDTVVLVDGGTDILMRGDEAGLGTPEEDISSLAAVDSLPLRDKLVVCLGFGVDRYHGVCHAHFLESVAALSKQGGDLGVTALLEPMPEVAACKDAVAYVCEQMPRVPSIVSLSVVTAIEGEYGDVHRTVRTQGSELWINPLMSMYWAFDLTAVARRCLYLELLKDTRTLFDVESRIDAFRTGLEPIRPWKDIPV